MDKKKEDECNNIEAIRKVTSQIKEKLQNLADQIGIETCNTPNCDNKTIHPSHMCVECYVRQWEEKSIAEAGTKPTYDRTERKN